MNTMPTHDFEIPFRVFSTFKMFLNFFNQNMIALQYRVRFCPTAVRISCVNPSLLSLPHPPLLFLPIEVITEHGAELPDLLQQFPTSYLFHTRWYTRQCYSLSSCHPPLPLLCPRVCSLPPSLSSCPANRFISTIFLDFIYMH